MGSGETKAEGLDMAGGVALARLREGEPLSGVVGEDAVVVVKRGDSIFAIGAHCTHYGAPLEDGLVVGATIRCPWHHAVFDLRTGEAVGAPAFSSAGCYPVEVEGDQFRVLPKADPETPESPAQQPESVVILGAGASAAAAVETLRQEGYQGSITMIGQEESGPVDRPNLSKDYLAGEAPDEWIPLGGDDHWAELGVDLVKGAEVVAIDREGKRLSTAGGETYDYDVLIYATGGEPFVPPVEGLDSTRWFTLRSFHDAQRISEAAEKGDRALILGAGFIGLEVAGSLRNRDVAVTVVAPDEIPLAGPLGEELGGFVRSMHEEAGVEFRLGQTVERFDGTTAFLSDGGEVSFDFVVVGTGIRPRTELADKAGLKVDDGVLVDESLRTDDPSIYAVGDVARYPDPIGGGTARVEHWVLAQRLAQRAARHILGRPAPAFTEVPFFWSRHYGTSIAYVGHAAEYDEVVVHGSVEEKDVTVGYLKAGQVLAVATVGRGLASLEAEEALAQGDQETLREIIGRETA